MNEALAAGLTLALSTEVGALPEAKGLTPVFEFDPAKEAQIATALVAACKAGLAKEPPGLDDLSPEAWAEKLVGLARH